MVKIVSSDFRIRQTPSLVGHFSGFALPFFGVCLTFLGVRKHFSSPKGGGEVEVKNSPPPLETPLYIILFSDLVEVEVNLHLFFLNLKPILNIVIQTLQNRGYVYNDAY